jgi:hypothetical protein
LTAGRPRRFGPSVAGNQLICDKHRQSPLSRQLDHGDKIDLDQELGVSEAGDADERAALTASAPT